MNEVSNVSLPKSVAAYFAADRMGGEAVAECFSENGVVKDEGQIHSGQGAIRAWKKAASGKYQYTSTPKAWEEKEGKIVVTSHVAGSFPGSPIDVRYTFEVQNEKIASLEIVA